MEKLNFSLDPQKKDDPDYRAAAVHKYITGTQAKLGTWEGNKPIGFTEVLLQDLPEIVQSVQRLRAGTKDTPAVDITIGSYCAERYGIATDEMGSSDALWRMLKLDKSMISLNDLHRTGRMNFTTMPELNKNFEWLIGETITEALRAGLLQRGVYRRLIQSQETVPYDSIKIPVHKKPNGRWRQYKEGATIRISSIEFDEIAVECKDIAQGFRMTDKVVRNCKINILQEALMGIVGQQLDDQLTYAAVQRLINGNTTGVDGAPIVGVDTIGTITYDEDWLEMVIGGAELGYRFDTVLGVRKMIKQVMALPEFKGFDGNTKLAQVGMDVPIPSQYLLIPTGAMPAMAPTGGQLLFLDPRRAMKLFISKPISIENDRIARELTTETFASMTFAFVKQYADASMIMDTTVTNVTDPFPEDMDAEQFQSVGF